jgi:hypothetical protein
MCAFAIVYESKISVLHGCNEGPELIAKSFRVKCKTKLDVQGGGNNCQMAATVGDVNEEEGCY